MRGWKTPRLLGYSKRHANRILKKQLENDLKELLDPGINNSLLEPIPSTSGGQCSASISEVDDDESSYEDNSQNCEIREEHEQLINY